MRRKLDRALVIATHNPGKLKEMRELLAPFGVVAQSAGELGLAEPQETGSSFAANARIKAMAAAKATGRRSANSAHIESYRSTGAADTDKSAFTHSR